jgi:phosphoribosylformylglycinamidine cyclo-ligase
MLRTFNCGIGMVVVAAADAADAVADALTEAGEAPVRLGHITERGAEAVTFTGQLAL